MPQVSRAHGMCRYQKVIVEPVPSKLGSPSIVRWSALLKVRVIFAGGNQTEVYCLPVITSVRPWVAVEKPRDAAVDAKNAPGAASTALRTWSISDSGCRPCTLEFT